MRFGYIYIYIYNVFFKNNNNNSHFSPEYLGSTAKVRKSTWNVLSQYYSVLEKYFHCTNIFSEVV